MKNCHKLVIHTSREDRHKNVRFKRISHFSPFCKLKKSKKLDTKNVGILNGTFHEDRVTCGGCLRMIKLQKVLHENINKLIPAMMEETFNKFYREK